LRKFIAVIFAMLAAAVPVLAGSESVGTTSTNFIKIPPFARACGMGEAYTAVSDGIHGIYYNPAGMVSTVSYEISASHIAWFQKMNYEFLALVAPSPLSDTDKLGAAFAWFQVDRQNSASALPSYDNSFLNSTELSDYITGSFAPYDYSVILAYAREFNSMFSGGASVKFTSENIEKFSGSNVTANMGFMLKHMLSDSTVKIGLDVSNIGPDLKMESIGYGSPILVRAGISDSFRLFDGRMLAAAQAIIQFDYESIYMLGAEYWFAGMAALRCGYKTGGFEHMTYGGGLKFSSWQLDYAYVNYNELGPAHRVTLIYSWGVPGAKLAASPHVFSPNSDGFLDFALIKPSFKLEEYINSAELWIFDTDGKTVIDTLYIKPHSKRLKFSGQAMGLALPDGVYTLQAAAKYDLGITESNKVKLEIDNTPPDMQVNAEPKLLKPGQTDSLVIPATFTLFAADKNNVSSWQFVIWDKNRSVFYNEGGKGEPPVSVIWDGSGANGSYINTGEIYYYSLITTDSVGNREQTKPEAVVVLLKEIKLSFNSDALFETGEADVLISAYSELKKMRDVLNKYPESKITVAGYTDNVQPRGNKYKNNKELSKARADAVKFFMVTLLSMDENRISTVGYGEDFPIADNLTQEGRLKNRRVEVTIESTIYK